MFRRIAQLLLKGKSDPVQVFERLSPNAIHQSALDQYVAAYTLMEAGDEAAAEAFTALVQAHPRDALVALHHRRLQAREHGSTVVLREK